MENLFHYKNILNLIYFNLSTARKSCSTFKFIHKGFSTLNYSKHIIDPYYISGLTQADGSFFCSIEKILKKDLSKGLTFTPIFDITMDLESKHTLEMIQNYFGCGKVHTKLSDNTARYRVINRKDLVNIIIPHFKTYPVFFNKLHAFNLFSQILDLLSAKPKERDLKKILTLSVSMNSSSKRTEKDILELSQILGINDTIEKIPDNVQNITSEFKPGFLAGLIDGDGSFNISFPQNLNSGKIKPVLSLCLGQNALALNKEIKNYLGPGGVISNSKSIFILKIDNLDQLINYVIPFIDSNPLLTKKKDHYEIWKQVCLILKAEQLAAVTKSTFLRIVELAYNMNKEGKRRKIPKEEYINLINNFYS